jgi:septum formation protein
MKKIILASASPRRKQLLKQIGLEFDVVVSNVDEKFNPRYKPRRQAEILSRQKAQAVAENIQNAVIIGADTIVSLGDDVIGKPKDAKEAVRILKKLSGRMHYVYTGFTIIDTDTNKSITKSVETKVWMRKLTNKEIKKFIEREKPYDKAGAYAIHELAAVFVEKIDGDFFNVVGLSLFELSRQLKKFGINVI